MKTSKFSQNRIEALLEEYAGSVATAELCRREGISSATFYKWKAKYGVI